MNEKAQLGSTQSFNYYSNNRRCAPDELDIKFLKLQKDHYKEKASELTLLFEKMKEDIFKGKAFYLEEPYTKKWVKIYASPAEAHE